MSHLIVVTIESYIKMLTSLRKIVVDNYYVWIQTRKVHEKMDFILGKVNALKPICAEEEYEDAFERVFE